jgi:hypothetical protein
MRPWATVSATTSNQENFVPLSTAGVQGSAYNPTVCSAHRALYFLVPMLYEPGLGTSLTKRDHLALDEPNDQLTSPT